MAAFFYIYILADKNASPVLGVNESFDSHEYKGECQMSKITVNNTQSKSHNKKDTL